MVLTNVVTAVCSFSTARTRAQQGPGHTKDILRLVRDRVLPIPLRYHLSKVLLILALAVFIGEMFQRAGLPSVAGELLRGLILGPTVLGVVSNNAEIQGISTISLFFIIFLIGLEMRTETIRKHIFQGTLVTVTSFIAPFAIITFLSVRLFQFGVISDLVVALVIAVPSISIVSVMVLQYGLLELQTGQTIVSSTVISDTRARASMIFEPPLRLVSSHRRRTTSPMLDFRSS